MKFIKKAKRGFTLVELVVVIAVIAILAAVSVGAYFGITDSANKSKLESEARGILTNIQLIANGNDSNYYMDREGIHIKEGGLEAFETKLNGMSGIDYEVINQAPTSVSKQTVYFIDTKEVSGAAASFETYYRYAYYTPEVGGKCAVYTFETNELKVTDANFDVTKPDSPTPDAPAPEVTVNSVNIEIDETNKDSHEFYVGQTANISITTDPENLDYTTSFSVPGIVDYSGGALVKALAAGTTIFTVTSKDDNTKSDSVTFTVKENSVTGMMRTDNNVCKTNYFEGETFDPTGLQLVLTYEIGDPVPVNMSEVTYDKTTLHVGDNVVCTYGEYTYTLELDVQAIEIQLFEASVDTIAGKFYAGSNFEADITFDVKYNNGDQELDLTLNDVDYDPELVVGQTSILFSYPKGAENPKTLEIDFEFPVFAVELESISVTNTGTAKTIYEVGEAPSKDGLVFTAIYNNGDEQLIENVNLITIVTEEITNSTEYITYSYTEGEITKTVNFDITVTHTKIYYFLDQDWWSNVGISSWFKIYDADKNFLRVDGIGTEMTRLVDTYAGMSDNSVWEIELDMNNARYIQIFRGTETDGVFKDGKTKLIDIEKMEGNNLIVLSTTEARNNSEHNFAEADVEFETYVKGETYRELHIVGLGNNGDADWKTNENTKFSYDPNTQTYTKTDVTLNLNDEFKFKFSNFGRKYFGYGINIQGINGLTGTAGGNIVISTGAPGIYTITVSIDGVYTFTKTGAVTIKSNYYLMGNFTGGSWNNKLDKYNFISVDGGLTYTTTVTLKSGNDFKVSDGTNWFGSFDSKLKPYFDSYDGNVRSYVAGEFTIRFDLSSKKIYIDNPNYGTEIGSSFYLRGTCNDKTDRDIGVRGTTYSGSNLHFFKNIKFNAGDEFKLFDGNAWYGADNNNIEYVTNYFEGNNNIKVKTGKGGTYNLVYNTKIYKFLVI